MNEQEQIQQAIQHLENQRTVLGNAAVDAAILGLRQKLAIIPDRPAADSPAEHQKDLNERKLVTTLFADLSGFTALSEKMDPEAVRDLINNCFAQLVPCIENYAGVIDKFMGDEIMALFGAPTAHENDAERAVRAALDMNNALANFNRQFHTDLGMHVGINTGLVLAGVIGAGERQGYSVIGDAVNLASRLGDASERGQILVGPDTYRLTAPLFEYKIFEPIRLKGKAEPTSVYQVLGLKAQPGNVRGLETKGIHSPLVGREDELAQLCAGVQRLVGGQGGVIGVIGEAGLGKSRLLAEARSIASASWQTPQWLEGHAFSFGQTISYYPFQEILRNWAGICDDIPESEAWQRLEAKTQRVFGADMADYLPYLASLLALEVKGDYVARVKYLDDRAMGQQIFLTVRRLFEKVAQSQPTILVFEDLHWMDESSARLLEHLLPLVENASFLIIILTRPEQDAPSARLHQVLTNQYAHCFTEIRLSPLSNVDSATLAHNLLEIEDLPERMRALIVSKAEGNPFFLEEVIRTLIDTSAVQRDPASGRWRVMANVDAAHIPDTIQGVIMARIDRLDEELKKVLRLASVIGRSFLYRILKAIVEAESQLDVDLAQLQQSEIIHEKQTLPELEYIFHHALMQEATYESTLLQKRREIHARVGQAIETLFAGRLEEFYGLLAYHYARAEAWEKAHFYLVKAGDQAGRMAADAEALDLYERAFQAYERAFGSAQDPLQAASLERKMGEAFERRGEYPQALEHLQRSLAHLGYRLPITRWEVQWALVRELAEQVMHRLQPGHFRKALKEPAGPELEEEVFTYFHIAQIDGRIYPERLVVLGLRLLNFSERRGYALGIVIGSSMLGIGLDFIKNFGLAQWYHKRSVGIAEKIQQPLALSNAYFGLQLHNFFKGEMAQSLDYGSRSARAYFDSGNLEGWGTSNWLLAWGFAHRGDFPEAMEQCQALIRFGQDAGARVLCCSGEATQSYVLRRQGRLSEVKKHQQKAIELAETMPHSAYDTLMGAEVGMAHLLCENLQAALSALEKSADGERSRRKRSVSNPHSLIMLYNNLAEAYLWAVEHGEPAERAIWLSKAKAACHTALKEAPRFQPKWPKAMRLQGTYQWLCGKPGAAQKCWQRSLAEAERMGLRYDLGIIYLEMGQRLGLRVHLEQAAALFESIGAELQLAHTQQILASAAARDDAL